VRVTGTRFAAEWDPASGKLAIEMFEGSVIVEGPSLGKGLALTSGQSLGVGVSSPAVLTRTRATERAPVLAEAHPGNPPSAPTQAVAPATAHAATAPVSAPAELPATATARPTPSWSDLAGHRRYAEALAAAEREGFLHLCRHLDAAGLLALGDAARYASSPNRARQAYQALVRRFARDQRSQDALFALGRLESDSGSLAAAARWFERYLGSTRNPPLGEEAAGRLVELYDRAGDREAATRAARDYLDRHPDGLRAGLARRILAARQPGEVPK
jgi:TolA-binding protein